MLVEKNIDGFNVVITTTSGIVIRSCESDGNRNIELINLYVGGHLKRHLITHRNNAPAKIVQLMKEYK